MLSFSKKSLTAIMPCSALNLARGLILRLNEAIYLTFSVSQYNEAEPLVTSTDLATAALRIQLASCTARYRHGDAPASASGHCFFADRSRNRPSTVVCDESQILKTATTRRTSVTVILLRESTRMRRESCSQLLRSRRFSKQRNIRATVSFDNYSDFSRLSVGGL